MSSRIYIDLLFKSSIKNTMNYIHLERNMSAQTNVGVLTKESSHPLFKTSVKYDEIPKSRQKYVKTDKCGCSGGNSI